MIRVDYNATSDFMAVIRKEWKMTESKARLSLETDLARWQWLKPHSERDSLFVVSHELEIEEVGKRLADDDAEIVQRWLASHLLAKPTAAQLSEWENDPGKSFNMLIVSPFILIQELTPSCY